MKNKRIFALSILLASPLAVANDDIVVKIDSLSNITGASAMEACGTAKHKTGIKPLWVTVVHDASEYSTLTSPSDKFGVVIKRWTFRGTVNATAQVLPVQNQESKYYFRI